MEKPQRSSSRQHPTLRTPRLILRPWRDADLAPFAELNADPRVMQHMPELLSREKSDAVAKRVREHFDREGFGGWAVELPGIAPFIGFVGISKPSFQARFTPCVEVGWRLSYEHWGRGYATEAARAAVEFGFTQILLDEIVSFTVPQNWRSRKVMERLGMTCSRDEDFEHPILPAGHPLSRHVLYRLKKADWQATTGAIRGQHA